MTPDRIQSHGLDLSSVLSPSGTGLVWAAVKEGEPIERSRASRTRENEPLVRASLVQVTNLAISVKDSPQNTLVWVTRLDNAAPVAGARVSIVKPDGQAMWTGTTGADGVAIAPETRLRNPRNWYEFAFLVMAEKDGDVAYVGSDWNDGILPWEFGIEFRSGGSRSAAARHGVHRSRRLQAGRRGSLQGDPAQQHAGGRPAAARRHRGLRSRCATRATRSSTSAPSR